MPNMALWDKKPPKMPLNLFSVGHLLQGMQPTYKSNLFPQWDSLGEKQIIICKWLPIE